MADEIQFPEPFANVLQGFAHAKYYKAQADKEKREGAAGPDVAAALGGDRDAVGRVALASPDLAMRLSAAMANMDYRQQTLAKSHIELAGRLAAGVLSAPESDRPALYAAALDQARQLGIDTRNYPQTYGPATEGWLRHNVQMLGTAAGVVKRFGAPAGAGAGGGGGGWTNPATPGARTSGLVPGDTGAPPTSVAALPQAVPPPVVAQTPPPRPTGAPTALAGAGPMPMAVPPGPPQIAPTAAPVAPPAPVQTAGAQPPQAPQVVSQDQVYAQGGNDGVYKPVAQAGNGRWVGLDPGDTIKVDRHNEPISKDGMLFIQKADGRLMMFDPKAHKAYTAHDLGDRVELIDPDSGVSIRTVSKGLPPADQPGSQGLGPNEPDPAIAALRGFQPPPGWAVATRGGKPLVSDGVVMLTRPDDPNAISFVPLPQRVDPQQALDLAAAKAQANAKAIPPAVLHGIDQNLTSLRKIDTVFAALDKNPDSVGGPGSVLAANLPGVGGLQNRMDKGGVELRALIADIGSLKLHDRSGAAVTASEEPRLRPFIPSISDDPATVRKKLGNFKNEYLAVLRDQQAYYAPDNGFRPYKGLDDYLSRADAPAPAGGPSAPSAPPAAAPAVKPTLTYNPATGRLE